MLNELFTYLHGYKEQIFKLMKNQLISNQSKFKNLSLYFILDFILGIVDYATFVTEGELFDTNSEFKLIKVSMFWLQVNTYSWVIYILSQHNSIFRKKKKTLERHIFRILQIYSQKQTDYSITLE